jgi:uncharacterized protein (DUF305 family)
MKNTTKYYAFSLVAIVAFVGVSVYAINRNSDNNTGNTMMKNSQMSDAVVAPNKDSNDYKMMAAVNGEEYDRLFLANMIAHHQGAIDMANLAPVNAKHQELKDLAKNIVTAQTGEISNMTAWQNMWNYPASSGTGMMDHSAMGMEDTNAGMMNALKDKTGDAFDKAFMEQMIMHHQSAIDMAASGKANAQHQEVRDLTAAIITAQTKEIKEMHRWQKNWGYNS